MRIDFRSTQRGYTLVLSQDLFGAYILYRRWFGLTNRRGGMKQQIFVEEEKVMREVGRISRARTRNGYELVLVAEMTVSILETGSGGMFRPTIQTTPKLPFAKYHYRHS